MDEYLLTQFLNSSALIESDHPLILDKTEMLTKHSSSDEQRAEHIFYFIRDSIRYTFIPKFQEEAYRASSILMASRGFCTQKAILFCAIARCAGIPAGIHFYDIIDHSLPRETADMMQTNTFYRHGIAELNLSGKWRQFDATLDKTLVQRNGYLPVEFDHKKDCLMNDVTISGQRHIEYVKDHGMVASVNFDEIMTWFRNNYPNLKQILSTL